MTPNAKQLNREGWYQIAVGLVMALVGIAVGVFTVSYFKQSKQMRVNRDANEDLLQTRVAPALRKEATRYPDKEVQFIVSVADKQQGKVVPFTSRSAIYGVGDQGQERLEFIN